MVPRLEWVFTAGLGGNLSVTAPTLNGDVQPLRLREDGSLPATFAPAFVPDNDNGDNGAEDSAATRRRFASTDPYTVLGLVEPANLQQLQRAYRRLSRAYHPDKQRQQRARGRGLSEQEAKTRFRHIAAAHNRLLRALQRSGTGGTAGGRAPADEL